MEDIQDEELGIDISEQVFVEISQRAIIGTADRDASELSGGYSDNPDSVEAINPDVLLEICDEYIDGWNELSGKQRDTVFDDLLSEINQSL